MERFVKMLSAIFCLFGVTAIAAVGSQLTFEKHTSQIYAPNVTPSSGTGVCSNQLKDDFLPDFMQGTLASFSVTLFSELGDKTFFLAAILAMKLSRKQVFVGATAALASMTVLSVIFGIAASIVPKVLLRAVSTILLAAFGFNMLREGMAMTKGDGLQEYEKCKEGLNSCENKEVKVGKYFAATQAFTLTLLGELGDRSQIATILLATTENAYGVAAGGVLGHMLCTAAAVLGGRLLAQSIPVKTMTITGGMVFLIFAISSWVTS